MNIEKMTEFIETFKEVVTSIDIENGESKAIEEYNDKIDKVIGLLQRGEKYEILFSKLEKEFEDREQELVKMIKGLRRYKAMWEESDDS